MYIFKCLHMYFNMYKHLIVSLVDFTATSFVNKCVLPVISTCHPMPPQSHIFINLPISPKLSKPQYFVIQLLFLCTISTSRILKTFSPSIHKSFLRLGPVIYPGVECFLHCNKKTYICHVIGL